VLVGFYVLETLVVLLGCFVWLRDHGYLAPAESTP